MEGRYREYVDDVGRFCCEVAVWGKYDLADLLNAAYGRIMANGVKGLIQVGHQEYEGLYDGRNRVRLRFVESYPVAGG